MQITSYPIDSWMMIERASDSIIAGGHNTTLQIEICRNPQSFEFEFYRIYGLHEHVYVDCDNKYGYSLVCSFSERLMVFPLITRSAILDSTYYITCEYMNLGSHIWLLSMTDTLVDFCLPNAIEI